MPLPSATARLEMFKHHLPEILPDLADAGQYVKTSLDYEKLSKVIGSLTFYIILTTHFTIEIS